MSVSRHGSATARANQVRDIGFPKPAQVGSL